MQSTARTSTQKKPLQAKRGRRRTQLLRRWGRRRKGRARLYMEKMGECKDAAGEKAREGKEKMGEYKDSAVKKAEEGKDSALGRIICYRDSAAEAARRARDYLTGKKEEVKEKSTEAADATKETMLETEDDARRKMEEATRRGQETKEVAAKRGSAGKSNILSSIGNMTEAIKEKLTLSKDKLEKEHEVGGDHGGEG